MNTEAKVGAFVVVAMAILLGTVYRISNMQLKGARVSYRTYLRYAGGLQSGADVLFGGIKVGAVTGVHPDPQDPTRIEILMDVKQGTPVNANSVAKLGSITIVTSPCISISMGTNDASRLPPNSVIASLESISVDDTERKIVALADSAKSLLESVHGDVDGLTGDGRKLVANLNELSGAPNREHVAEILANADKMIATISPKVDRISDQVARLADEANTLVARAGPAVDHANATFSNANDTITAAREPLQNDLAELRKTLDQARATMGDVQASLRAKDQGIADTLENLRTATDNLTELTESVKERPWSLVRIKQPKDRRVPK